jgi:catalase
VNYPESCHMLTWLLDEPGIPTDYRHQEGKHYSRLHQTLLHRLKVLFTSLQAWVDCHWRGVAGWAQNPRGSWHHEGNSNMKGSGLLRKAPSQLFTRHAHAGYGVNTFVLVNSAGKETFVKVRTFCDA